MPRTGPVTLWRRFGIRLLAVLLLGALTGAGWLAWRQPRAARPLTSSGRPVANSVRLLAELEHRVTERVRSRHGVLAGDARCYYTARTVPADPGAAVPIEDRLLCGPALLVDGDPAKPYLSYQLTSSPDGHGSVRLAVADQNGELPSADPRPALDLIRPDGRRPTPSRLTPPAPPPAVGDVLTTTSTVRGTLNRAGRSAVMIGRRSGARLLDYGFVDGYGTGDRARRAPDGYRLLAFSTSPVAGESGAQPPRLSVLVNGAERGPLLATSDHLVVAVPAVTHAAALVLTDGGLRQSISLLTGAPDPSNPALSERTSRAVSLSVSRPVRVRVRTSQGTGVVGGVVSFRGVSLSYWAPDGTPCSSPGRAWLHVLATVRLDGDRQAYGVEAPLLSVAAAGARPVPSRNAAVHTGTEVDDVVEVPAGLTSARLSYSGMARTAKGTITVLTPVSAMVAIPAG